MGGSPVPSTKPAPRLSTRRSESRRIQRKAKKILKSAKAPGPLCHKEGQSLVTRVQHACRDHLSPRANAKFSFVGKGSLKPPKGKQTKLEKSNVPISGLSNMLRSNSGVGSKTVGLQRKGRLKLRKPTGFSLGMAARPCAHVANSSRLSL